MTPDVNSTGIVSKNDPGHIPDGFVYRDQGKRYPWWVKSVDRITVENKSSEIQKPTTNMIIMSLMRRLEDPEAPWQRQYLVKKIRNGDPGFNLPDVSLEFASQAYFQSSLDIDGNSNQAFRKIREVISGRV